MRRNAVNTILALLLVLTGPTLAQDCLQYANHHPDLAPTGPQIHREGPAQATAVKGGIMALARDACVQLFDVTDPQEPEFLAEIGLSAEYLAMGEGALYAARQGYGLNVVDISDPRAPRIVTAFPHPLGSMDMLVHGQHLFIVPDLYAWESWFGVIVYDISDPVQPVLVVEAEGGAGFNVAMHGDVMILSNYDPSYANLSYLSSVDMSDPGQPVFSSEWINYPGRTRDVAVRGNHLYAVTDTHGLYVIDISDPEAMTIVHEDPAHTNGLGVAVVDDALVVLRSAGLGGQAVTLSLDDPAHPMIMDATAFSGIPAGHDHEGGWLYVAAGDGDLALVDLRVPALPELRPWNGVTPPHPELVSKGIAVSGNTMYVGSEEGDALHVVDMSAPLEPRIVTSLYTNLEGGDVAVHDDLLFQMMKKPVPPYDRWLDVYSLADPHQPQRLSRTNLGVFTLNLTPASGAVYSTLNGLIHVINVKNPAAPAYHQALNPPGNGNGRNLLVDDGFLYAPLTNSGLVIYDIANVLEPVLAAVVELPYCYGVSIVGDLAYATDYYDGVVVIDVSDAYDPVILARNGEIVPDQYLLAHGDHLYITDYEHGGWVYDIATDPLVPLEVGRFFMPASTSELVAVGPWVALSQSTCGVQFVWQACSLPTAVGDGLPSAETQPLVVPNPFNPLTSIRYSTVRPGPVTVTVHDLAGRAIRTLVSAWRGVGDHSVAWDGRTATGASAASGSYVVRVVTPAGVSTARATLVR